MKRITLPLLVLAAGLVLAYLALQHTHSDIMALILGVAVGIIASVPTSLLLVWGLGHNCEPPTTQRNLLIWQPSERSPWQVLLRPLNEEHTQLWPDLTASDEAHAEEVQP